jgi:hypothetical protein
MCPICNYLKILTIIFNTSRRYWKITYTIDIIRTNREGKHLKYINKYHI